MEDNLNEENRLMQNPHAEASEKQEGASGGDCGAFLKNYRIPEFYDVDG